MSNEELNRNEIKDENDETLEVSSTLNEINGKKMTYKPKEVASMLCTSPEMLRYYCNEFSEFLNLNHEPGKHRVYTENDISKLKYIIYLCKDRNFSSKQAKEFLSTPEGKLFAPIQSEEEHMEVFIDLLSKGLNSTITQTINTVIDAKFNALLSEHKLSLSEVKEVQSEIKDKVETLVSASSKNTEKINSIHEITENKMSELIKQNENISNEISKVDQMIATYRERLSNRQAEADSQSKTKRIFPFNLFNKK